MARGRIGRRGVSMVAVLALGAATLGSAAFVPPAGATSGPLVTLVVGRAAGVTNAQVSDRLGGVASGSADAVPHLAASTVSVPAGEVAEATTRLDGVATYVQPSVTFHAASLTPVDPQYPSQGELRQIDAPSAWADTTGAGVTVAVVDTGIVDGPDFTDSFGTSIVPGYDEVDGDTNPTDVSSGDPDWSSHGTLVSSILAARANTFGVVGMCPGCHIMPIRALGSDGTGSDVDIALGIQYATAHGASVINLSLGGSSDSGIVDQAIDQARAANVVVVAAAGNDGDSTPLGDATAPTYPAAHPGVLSVAATCSQTAFADGSNDCLGETDGNLEPFTGRGAGWVDVAAPGTAIATQGTDLYDFSGTSASTPFVSGLAALVRAEHPTWSEQQVRADIVQTAAPVSPGGLVAGGEIRAGAAVGAGTPPPPGPISGATAPSGSLQPPAGVLSSLVQVVVEASGMVPISAVELIVDGQPVAALSPAGGGQWSGWWDSDQVGDGAFTETAEIIDQAGVETTTAPVGGLIDNHPPNIHLFGPANGSVEKQSFGVVTIEADAGTGVRATFIAANGVIVGGSIGPATFGSVPVRKSGKITIVAATIDQVGHIAFSNFITVTGRPGRR